MVGRGGRDPIFFIPSTYGGITKISFLGAPEVGEKQCMEKKKEEEKESSYAINVVPCRRHQTLAVKTISMHCFSPTSGGHPILTQLEGTCKKKKKLEKNPVA